MNRYPLYEALIPRQGKDELKPANQGKFRLARSEAPYVQTEGNIGSLGCGTVVFLQWRKRWYMQHVEFVRVCCALGRTMLPPRPEYRKTMHKIDTFEYRFNRSASTYLFPNDALTAAVGLATRFIDAADDIGGPCHVKTIN